MEYEATVEKRQGGKEKVVHIAYKNGKIGNKKIAGSFHFNIFQPHHMNMKKEGRGRKRKNGQQA